MKRADGDDDGSADFGYTKIQREDKAGLVRDVFDRVASRYDLMNDLMSGGVHRLWKSTLLDRANPQPGATLIDVAGGTGDMARGFLARAASRPNTHGARGARAFVCDVNFEMLSAGKRSAAPEELAWICGDAERLPLPDSSCDAYVISFGIRNVTDIDAALGEARRVLKFGGQFLCLEFSRPITEGFQKIYDAYSFAAIPWLGEHVAGDRESYQYLVESIRRFPTQDKFAAMIRAAGLGRVAYENLTGGVVALHTGWKL